MMGILYLFNFFKSLQFFGALVIPFYLYRLGMDYTQMFALETVFSVLLFLMEIPTGVIADRTGRKVSLFCGTMLCGVGFFVYALTKSFPVLLAVQPILACGISLISGCDRALLYETARQAGRTKVEIASINARYDAFGTAGMFCAFPAGTLIASSNLLPYESGLAVSFASTAFCLLLSGVIILFTRESLREKTHQKAFHQGFEGFRHIFKVPALRRLALNYTVVSACTFLMFWYYQSLLLEYRFPQGYVGFIAAGFNALGLMSLFAVPFVQKKIKISLVLFFTAFVPGLLYISLFFASSLILVIVAIFGVTVMRLFRTPLMVTLMNGYIGDANRAAVLSGVSMLERIVIALCYIPFGILSDISLDWTFLALGLLTLLATFVLRVRKSDTESSD